MLCRVLPRPWPSHQMFRCAPHLGRDSVVDGQDSISMQIIAFLKQAINIFLTSLRNLLYKIGTSFRFVTVLDLQF